MLLLSQARLHVHSETGKVMRIVWRELRVSIEVLLRYMVVLHVLVGVLSEMRVAQINVMIRIVSVHAVVGELHAGGRPQLKCSEIRSTVRPG